MAEKLLWNDGWSFVELSLEEDSYIYPVLEEWKPVEITHVLSRDSIGWYKKEFMLEEMKGHYALRFDGISMEMTLYVNGHEAFDRKEGDSVFEADITDYMQLGKNKIVVRVISRGLNTNASSDTGIFRTIWFKTKNNLHLVSDGIHVTGVKESDTVWRVETDTEIAAKCAQCAGCSASHVILKQKLYDTAGTLVAEAADEFAIAASMVCSQIFTIENPKLCEIVQDNLYHLVTELWLNGRLLESEEQKIAFRTLEFHKDKDCV